IEDWRNHEANDGYFNIPVGEGQDGKLWRISNDKGYTLRLMSVPPYMARSGEELLLPLEVFEGEESPSKDDEENEEQQGEALPESFELNQNYPNPFNPSTRIKYALPQQMHVRLDVFNLLGQRVSTLLNEVKSAGRYEVIFDATGLSSGLYLYRLQAETFTEIRQMLLVK
ncbi:MAG: T9SS type A sorting domain-containing protein, partial [Bacteroidota bacterium]